METIYHKLQKLIKIQDLEIIRMMCELEKQILLTVMNTQSINERVAGRLLTGKDDFFFKIIDNQGWLTRCKKINSPWIEQEKCYNKIPILYQGITQFIDIKTRKIADPYSVKEIDCMEEASKMKFQINQDKDSWFVFIPKMFHKSTPAKIKPFIVSANEKITSLMEDTINTGIYNIQDLKDLYKKIQDGEKNQNLITDIIDDVIVNTGGGTNFKGHNYWSPSLRKEIYIDNMISKDILIWNLQNISKASLEEYIIQ